MRISCNFVALLILCTCTIFELDISVSADFFSVVVLNLKSHCDTSLGFWNIFFNY